MTDYTLHNGDTTTTDEIRAAFQAGRAVLVHNRADGGTHTGLMLDGEHRDTRGQCESMWDEVWTTMPESMQQACLYAR